MGTEIDKLRNGVFADELASVKKSLQASEKELKENKRRLGYLEHGMLLHKKDGGQAISFQVRQKSHKLVLTNHDVFRFDDVTLNVGNAYNPTSGVFTVPATGLYLFWGNIMGVNEGQFVVTLQKNGKEVDRAHTSYNTGHGVGTLVYMTQLTKGDRVWFSNEERGGSQTVIYGKGYSSYGAFKYM